MRGKSIQWNGGLERSFDAEGPEGAEVGGLAEAGAGGGLGAVDDDALGLVVHVAEVEKEREVAAQRNLAEHVDIQAVVAPVVDRGSDAVGAGRGDGALTTLALIVEVDAEIVARAREADAPVGAFRLVAGEEIGGGAGDALAASERSATGDYGAARSSAARPRLTEASQIAEAPTEGRPAHFMPKPKTARPPHSPAPIPILAVPGATGAKANS